MCALRFLPSFCRCLLPVLLATAAFAQHPAAAFHPLQLHADKQFFLPGEPVFFTVFKVTPDSLPRNACIVILSDERGQVLETCRLLLSDEPAAGHLMIPAGDSAAWYSLQCRLDDGAQSPPTGILLFSALREPPALHSASRPALLVESEAGTQAAASAAVYFFRLRGDLFLHTPFRYAVLSADGDTLAAGLTDAFGAGRMEFPAATQGDLRFMVQAGERELSLPLRLPSSAPGRAMLNVYPVPGARVSRVRAAVAGAYTLELSQEGTVYYRGTVELQAGDDFSKTFREGELRRGLSYLRLRDASGSLLGERPLFREQALPVAVRGLKRARPDKLRLQLTASLKGIFSVSVTPYRAEEVPAAVDDTLLQVSGLQGREIRLRTPDSLLLQVRRKAPPGNYAQREIKLFIRTPGQDEVLETRTDTSGWVRLDRTQLSDPVTLLALPRQKQQPPEQLIMEERQQPLQADSLLAADYRVPVPVAGTAETIVPPSRFAQYRAKWLKEVVVKTRARSKMELLEETYASPMYQSKVNQVAAFDLSSGYDNELMGSLLTFLQGRIPPVKNTAITSGTATDGYNYYVNESLVDRSTANSIPLSEIAFISVMGRNFVPLTGEMGPAVLVYTKKGRDRHAAAGEAEKNHLLTVQGYQVPRPYFNPLFEEGGLPGTLRTTLYWNPRFRIRGDDQLEVELFSAYPGPVLLRLRGWDDEGRFRVLDQVIE